MAETPGDEELMLRYADGDAEAFAVVYRRNKDPLFRFLLRQCRSSAIAEELFQDVWLKVIAARRRYSPTAAFRTFLFQIARNRLIDHYRQEGRAVNGAGDDCDAEMQPGPWNQQPELKVEIDQSLNHLQQAVESLPLEQREAFLLRQEGGMSLSEIAMLTGVNEETAKSRLRYALKKLRTALENPDE